MVPALRDIASAILRILAIPVKYLVVVWSICLVSLFLPTNIARWLGLQTVLTTYRTWLGAIALVTTMRIVVSAAWPLGKIFVAWISRPWIMRRNLQLLRSLSAQERDLLRCNFVVPRKTTATLDYTSGVVEGLVRKGVLYTPSAMAVESTYFDYNLAPWVVEALRDHPDVLD